MSKGLQYMALGAFFFSLMSLCAKLVVERIPTQEVVFIRSLLTFGFSYIALKRLQISPWGVNKKLLFLRGLLGFIALSLLYYGFTVLPLADAIVLQYTNPVFAMLIAVFVLREAFTRREGLGTGLSLIGIICIAQPTILFGTTAAPMPALGVAAVLGCALLSGAAYVLVRKLRETEHYLVVVLYFPLICLFGSAPFLAMDFVWPTSTEWLLLIAVGITAQIAQIYMTKGLHLEKAGRATSVGYLQFVFALLWGMLFLAEFPNLWGLLGAILILGGLFLITRKPAASPPHV